MTTHIHGFQNQPVYVPCRNLGAGPLLTGGCCEVIDSLPAEGDTGGVPVFVLRVQEPSGGDPADAKTRVYAIVKEAIRPGEFGHCSFHGPVITEAVAISVARPVGPQAGTSLWDINPPEEMRLFKVTPDTVAGIGVTLVYAATTPRDGLGSGPGPDLDLTPVDQRQLLAPAQNPVALLTDTQLRITHFEHVLQQSYTIDDIALGPPQDLGSTSSTITIDVGPCEGGGGQPPAAQPNVVNSKVNPLNPPDRPGVIAVTRDGDQTAAIRSQVDEGFPLDWPEGIFDISGEISWPVYSGYSWNGAGTGRADDAGRFQEGMTGLRWIGPANDGSSMIRLKGSQHSFNNIALLGASTEFGTNRVTNGIKVDRSQIGSGKHYFPFLNIERCINGVSIGSSTGNCDNCVFGMYISTFNDVALQLTHTQAINHTIQHLKLFGGGSTSTGIQVINGGQVTVNRIGIAENNLTVLDVQGGSSNNSMFTLHNVSADNAATTLHLLRNSMPTQSGSVIVRFYDLTLHSAVNAFVDIDRSDSSGATVLYFIGSNSNFFRMNGNCRIRGSRRSNKPRCVLVTQGVLGKAGNLLTADSDKVDYANDGLCVKFTDVPGGSFHPVEIGSQDR